MSHQLSRLLLTTLALLSAHTLAYGQASVPGFLPSGNNVTLSGPPALGDATLTNALGAAGSTSGYHQYQWSTTSTSGILRINGQSFAPVPITLHSATYDGVTLTSGVAAANFDRTLPYSWKLFSAGSVGGSSTARIQLRTLASEGGAPAYYTPTDTSNAGSADDTRLNQIMSLNAANFIDNVTGSPITATAGYNGPGALDSTFSWRLTDYSATAGGFQSITLNYTPVPEPTLALASAAAVGFAAVRLRRRVLG